MYTLTGLRFRGHDRVVNLHQHVKSVFIKGRILHKLLLSSMIKAESQEITEILLKVALNTINNNNNNTSIPTCHIKQ